MNTKTLIILIVGVLVGASIFAAAFYFGIQSKKETILLISPTPIAFVSPTTAPMPTTIPETLTKNGIVEGSLSYPSEGIPNDLQVCAETLQGVLVKCTDTHIPNQKYQYGVGYNLELSEGNYYVYAVAAQGNRAYYTEFVTCGLLYSCPSHKKIEVQVISGQTTSKIDPGDWYNN